jgi:Tfp pilus assembly protein PilF
MKRLLPSLLLFAVVLCGLARPVAAQPGAQVRGFVVDESGKPLADVALEMQYVGEGKKRVYNLKTDKKGGFVRVGIEPGMYKIFFNKDGYSRYGIDIWLSLGSLSEICTNAPRPGQPCEPVVLKAAAPVPAPASGAPAPALVESEEAAARLGQSYKDAIAAIRAEQWEVAEALLNEVEAAAPGQPQVHFNLAYVHRQKGELPAAEAEYRKFIELQPAKAEGYLALSTLFAEAGKNDEALAVLTQARPSFEQDSAFLTALGAVAMNAGKEQEAEEAFSKVTVLDPANVEVQFHLASLAMNRNEIPDAIQHLEAYLAGAAPGAPNIEVAKSLLDALKAKKK